MLNSLPSILATGAPPVVPNSYYSIATQTVGSGGASSVSFTSIPSTYSHLQIRGIVQNAGSGTGNGDYQMMFNGDALSVSNSNYTQHRLFGTGASVSSDYYNGYIIPARVPNSGLTNIYAAFVVDILDYANTNKYKVTRTFTGFDQNGGGNVWLDSGVYLANTNAITSITIGTPGSNISQYSSFALYGVK